MAMTINHEETVMNRNDLHEDVIELGVASTDTRGNGVTLFDSELTQRIPAGLSDE